MGSKFNFTSVFPILVNLAVFLDYTKENADRTNNADEFDVNFHIFIEYIPEAISTLNLVALPITSQELEWDGFPPPTKIGRVS